MYEGPADLHVGFTKAAVCVPIRVLQKNACTRNTRRMAESGQDGSKEVITPGEISTNDPGFQTEPSPSPLGLLAAGRSGGCRGFDGPGKEAAELELLCIGVPWDRGAAAAAAKSVCLDPLN